MRGRTHAWGVLVRVRSTPSGWPSAWYWPADASGLQGPPVLPWFPVRWQAREAKQVIETDAPGMEARVVKLVAAC